MSIPGSSLLWPDLLNISHLINPKPPKKSYLPTIYIFLPSGSFPGKASASRKMANVSNVGGMRMSNVEISTDARTNSTVKFPMWSAKNSGATDLGYCKLCG